ncbi:MAG: hypothetical protein QM831_35200 [Kofleriaceae bacterium]
MIRVGLLASVLVAGCASDDSHSLTGHWDILDCGGGLYSSMANIHIENDYGAAIDDNVSCNDISFTTNVPSDFGPVEVIIMTTGGGVWTDPLTLNHDEDVGLITFRPGPLGD